MNRKLALVILNLCIFTTAQAATVKIELTEDYMKKNKNEIKNNAAFREKIIEKIEKIETGANLLLKLLENDPQVSCIAIFNAFHDQQLHNSR
ncbi:MAG: hypothetical protein AAF335_05235, partial [Bacteroidota bacterium]